MIYTACIYQQVFNTQHVFMPLNNGCMSLTLPLPMYTFINIYVVIVLYCYYQLELL